MATSPVEYEWDHNKQIANLAKHGVDFVKAAEFDWDTAIVSADDRRDYGELRTIAVGRIRERVYVMIFTPRQSKVRIISLRKANSEEVESYDSSSAKAGQHLGE